MHYIHKQVFKLKYRTQIRPLCKSSHQESCVVQSATLIHRTTRLHITEVSIYRIHSKTCSSKQIYCPTFCIGDHFTWIYLYSLRKTQCLRSDFFRIYNMCKFQWKPHSYHMVVYFYVFGRFFLIACLWAQISISEATLQIPMYFFGHSLFIKRNVCFIASSFYGCQYFPPFKFESFDRTKRNQVENSCHQKPSEYHKFEVSENQ